MTAKDGNADGMNLNLPHGWRWVQLGDVCNINPSRPVGFKRAPDALTTFVPMPAVDERQGIITNAETKPFSEVAKGYKSFGEGDVLFAKITPCMQNGKHAIAKGLIDGIGFGSTEFHVVRPKAEVIPEWIHRFLRQPHILSAAANHFTGAVGQQRVPESFLSSLEIPLPSLTEQERITNILNKQMAEAEKARFAAEARLEAAKALLAAYLREVFEGDEARRWSMVKFEEIAVLQRGYDLPFASTSSGPYPIVTSSGIAGYHNAFKTKGPGVITGRSGSIGKVYYVSGDFWPHNTALFVTDFKGNVPLYVFYLLQWMDLESVCSGTGVPTLDRKAVHKVTVPRPTNKIQESVSLFLNYKTEESKELIHKLHDELNEIKALPTALMRQAFSGGL